MDKQVQATLEILGFFVVGENKDKNITYLSSEKYNQDWNNSDLGISILEGYFRYNSILYTVINYDDYVYNVLDITDLSSVDFTIIGNDDEIKFFNDLFTFYNVYLKESQQFFFDNVEILELIIYVDDEKIGEFMKFRNGGDLGSYIDGQNFFKVWCYLDGSFVVDVYDADDMGFCGSFSF